MTVSRNHSAYVDFAMLTMCDHVIITIGTFSYWAAYLNGGEVVRPDRMVLKDTGIYYPPEWVTLKNE